MKSPFFSSHYRIFISLVIVFLVFSMVLLVYCTMNTPESRMDRLSSHFYAEPLLNSVSDICGQYMWDTDHIVSTYGGYTHSPIERIGLAYTPKHRQREYYE